MAESLPRPRARQQAPWHTESGTHLAERLCRAYAEWLLDVLPFVPEAAATPLALVEGYRALDRERAETAWRCHEADERRMPTRQGLHAKALATKATWELVHLHLVALKLAGLYATGVDGHALELVLVAEQAIEELAADIEVIRAPQS